MSKKLLRLILNQIVCAAKITTRVFIIMCRLYYYLSELFKETNGKENDTSRGGVVEEREVKKTIFLVLLDVGRWTLRGK